MHPRSPRHDNNYGYTLEVPHLPAITLVNDLDLAGNALPMHSSSPNPSDFDLPDRPLAAQHDLSGDEADVQVEDAPLFTKVQNSYSWVADYFNGLSAIYGVSETFLSMFQKDQYLEQRHSNIYYPFTSSKDWMEVSFLSKSRLSMAVIDKYLSMDVIR